MAITLNPFTGQFDLTGGGSTSISGSTPIVGIADNSILYNNGGVVGGVGPLTNGQLIIGSTGSDPVAAAITGTTDQITVTNGAGSISLSLPQNIATTSTPTFSQVTVSNDPSAGTDVVRKSYADSTYIAITEKGAALGVATLDGGGKVPVSQLPSSIMEYKGVWDASTNSPALVDGTGNTGDVYRVTVAGTQNLGSGAISFEVGDYVIYNGTTWEKSDTTDAVATVNGYTGNVVLTTSDIAEGTNLYFTDERAQDAVGSILTDSATIDFTYNDGANTITAIVIDGSITNAKIASGVDAAKIGSGSVDNTEFGYLDGVTSSIQTQIDNKVTINPNDIPETSFTGANNQAVAANVTGFAFANASVRAFSAIASVTVIATSSLYEEFQINGVQKGSGWDIAVSSMGDVSNVLFTINSSGQVQYTSDNYAGFTSLTIKFRAITVSL